MSLARKSNEPKPRRKVGGQSTYTPECGIRICVAITDGSALQDALAAEGIATSTWYQWVHREPELAEMYARAREALGDKLGLDVVTVARGIEPETAQSGRVLVDAMKWAAARMSPKNWGDRVGVEHSGKDGGPLKVEVEMIGGE